MARFSSERLAQEMIFIPVLVLCLYASLDLDSPFCAIGLCAIICCQLCVHVAMLLDDGVRCNPNVAGVYNLVALVFGIVYLVVFGRALQTRPGTLPLVAFCAGVYITVSHTVRIPLGTIALASPLSFSVAVASERLCWSDAFFYTRYARCETRPIGSRVFTAANTFCWGESGPQRRQLASAANTSTPSAPKK